MASQLKVQHRSQSESHSNSQPSPRFDDSSNGPCHHLILFRHATRASLFDNDTTLSTFGLAQAAAAPSLFEKNVDLPQPQEIFCSPKTRARQTVSPLCEFLKLSVQLDERLDERHSHESRADFEFRIRSFLADIEGKFHSPPTCAGNLHGQQLQLAKTVVACSHMDWLESIFPLMNSNLTAAELTQPWAAGEFRCLIWNPAGHWELGRVGVLLGDKG